MNNIPKSCNCIVISKISHQPWSITRTQTSVLFPWENRSGKQLYKCSMTCQPKSDGSKSIEGNVVFNSSLSLCRLGMFGKEGRHAESSARNLWRSVFFNTSGKCCREWRSTTLGTFIAVYMVRARKMKNPIKCLQRITKLCFKNAMFGKWKDSTQNK